MSHYSVPIIKSPRYCRAQPFNPLTFECQTFPVVLLLSQENNIDVKGVNVVVADKVGVERHRGSAKSSLVACESGPHALGRFSHVLFSATPANEAIYDAQCRTSNALVHRVGRLVDSRGDKFGVSETGADLAPPVVTRPVDGAQDGRSLVGLGQVPLAARPVEPLGPEWDTSIRL